MTDGIRTKDIDELLGLFQQLNNLFNHALPVKNKELWEQSLKQSKEELIEKLKKHQSQLSVRPPIRKASKKEEEKDQQIIQEQILKIAENRYRQKDSKYDQACSQIEEKWVEVVKKIDHALYSIKEQLLKFDRAQGTLLAADWKWIRNNLSINEIMQPQFQYLVQRAIDDLEAIRGMIERLQKVKPPEKPIETEQMAICAKIKALLWRLYEVTLKVIVDAVLERLWPKQ